MENELEVVNIRLVKEPVLAVNFIYALKIALKLEKHISFR